MKIYTPVESLNKGHFGTSHCFLYIEGCLLDKDSEHLRP